LCGKGEAGDMQYLNRKYFNYMVSGEFDEKAKAAIVNDIISDFNSSLPGLKKLPRSSKLGVLIAYYYYLSLLKKIKKNTCGETSGKTDKN
jgi:hypothetical protein